LILSCTKTNRIKGGCSKLKKSYKLKGKAKAIEAKIVETIAATGDSTQLAQLKSLGNLLILLTLPSQSRNDYYRK
jgi:hypothetical protein